MPGPFGSSDAVGGPIPRGGNMSSHVSWILELDLLEGRQSDFRELMAEMVSATTNEAGTLDYEWSTSADGNR
jgi:quinol monooxygenase YgiN